MGHAHDWIFWAVGGALGAWALWLLSSSLFKDRSRDRKRCPKCWYEIHVESATVCSECGYRPSRPRKWLKTRRRWRLTFLSAFILPAAVAVMLVPGIRQNGWASVVPSTALILALPWIDEGPIVQGWKGDAVEELNQRLPSLWDWQWWLLVDTSMAHYPGAENVSRTSLVANMYGQILEHAWRGGAIHRLDCEDDFIRLFPPVGQISIEPSCLIDVPARVKLDLLREHLFEWVEISASLADGTPLDFTRAHSPFFGEPSSPWGERLYGTIRLPESPGTYNIKFMVRVAVANRFVDAGTGSLEATWNSETSISVLGTALEDVIPPSRNRLLDQIVRSGLRYQFRPDTTPRLLRIDLSADCIAELDQIGDVLHAQLLRDGVVVYDECRGVMADSATHGGFAVFRLSDFHWRMGKDPAGPRGAWTLRIRIDPIEAYLWSYHAPPNFWQGESYWPGVIELPIDAAEIFGESR